MDKIKRSVLPAVIVAGLVFILTTDAIKTDRQIMTEIRSMANGIAKECTSELPGYYCSNYMSRMNFATSVNSMCLQMDSFSRCKSHSCVNKSQALKQILSDAMIIPYCTTLATFAGNQAFLAMAQRLTDMGSLCNFKPEMDCDLEFASFLKSSSDVALCYFGRYYAMCLEQKCQQPSQDMKQKIADVKNDTLCKYYTPPLIYVYTTNKPHMDGSKIPLAIPFSHDNPTGVPQYTKGLVKTTGEILYEIQSMAKGIVKECTTELTLKPCDIYLEVLTEAVTVYSSCFRMDSFTRCKSRYCVNKSLALKQILSDAMTIPYCTNLATFAGNQVLLAMAQRLTDMGSLCHFKPDMDCDWEFESFLQSRSEVTLCYYGRYYAMCLEQKCQQPSQELKQKIADAENEPLCRNYTKPNSYSFSTPIPHMDGSKMPEAIPFTNKPPVWKQHSTTPSQGRSSLRQVSVMTILMILVAKHL